ncbi:hypothetical protein N9O24_00835 [bacterium]|nr:hypothetical protein [bacterium]
MQQQCGPVAYEGRLETEDQRAALIDYQDSNRNLSIRALESYLDLSSDLKEKKCERKLARLHINTTDQFMEVKITRGTPHA